ncbi:hypothetical protein QVD17_20757 [Tagetes erecta]|uniref:Uncharacterized protein n=1 Tax=Tagetes erecta TaxID=13708 RepID=A0AAD8KLS2_TARER|nr:hypothetical protein QVD17_20757 [Tagetes erecta]
MKLQNGELSKELLNSQTHIWNHIFNFINSMSLKCAVELQIPDIIDRHGAPMSLSELVKALGIKPERTHSVYRLMRFLVHSGFFVKQSLSTAPEFNDEEQGEGYVLAPASRLLLQGPLSIRPFLGVRKSRGGVQKNGLDVGNSLKLCDPKLNRLFNEAMASDARLVMSVVLEHCEGVFEGLDSIVDVGGGTGTVAKAIAEGFHDIKCICFDLPHVVDGLVGSKNLSYVGGDMFEIIPNADAVLLKWILHDWSDDECIKILKHCREAIPSKENGGKVIIIDMVVKAHEGENDLLETQLFFDMLMMTVVTGKERSEEEWAKLFVNAGFSDYKITPMLGLRSLIEVYP